MRHDAHSRRDREEEDSVRDILRLDDCMAR